MSSSATGVDAAPSCGAIRVRSGELLGFDDLANTRSGERQRPAAAERPGQGAPERLELGNPHLDLPQPPPERRPHVLARRRAGVGDAQDLAHVRQGQATRSATSAS
jgi:hypothetical protein